MLLPTPAPTRSPATPDEASGLHDLVATAMLCSGYASLLFVDIEVEQGRVILRGRVPTYHLKQVAQSLIKRLPGVSRVDNRLLVQRLVYREDDSLRCYPLNANADRQSPQ